MPKQLLLSVMIDLPGDLFSDAEVASSVKDKWGTFLDGLRGSSVDHDATAEYIEGKRGPGSKRPERRATGKRIPTAPADTSRLPPSHFDNEAETAEHAI